LLGWDWRRQSTGDMPEVRWRRSVGEIAGVQQRVEVEIVGSGLLVCRVRDVATVRLLTHLQFGVLASVNLAFALCFHRSLALRPTV
jgi:hypothetical protein